MFNQIRPLLQVDSNMNTKISPKYQMNLIQNINDKLFELYKGYEDVSRYMSKWIEYYDSFENQNFYIRYKDNEQKKIDVKETLHSIDGETLLKIAIDLGVETPDFIPSIPVFKNELKSDFETASQTFEKAYKNVEDDPSLAIGLANSALECIIKEILSDDRVVIPYDERDTLSKLIKKICKAFKFDIDPSCPTEIGTIASTLIKCCNVIEDIRSSQTIFHGKKDDDNIVKNPLYAYFIVNSVSTIGLFLLSFYKEQYPKIVPQYPTDLNPNDLPF